MNPFLFCLGLRRRFAAPALALICFCGGGWAGQVASADEEKSKPNVVLFLVDDLGWRDLSCQGSDYYRTPNIDQLAAKGVRFTDAYAACAVCSPTRASVLTGKYPARLLLTQWLPAGRWSPQKNRMREGRFLRSLPLEEITLAETLREEDYATWHVGKWHLGGAPFSLPEHHGFDVNVAGSDHGAPGSYFFPFKGKWTIPTTGEVVLKQTLTEGNKGDYLTERLTAEVIGLITGHTDPDGDREMRKPFFLYFPYYAVHTPLQGKKDKMARYEAIAEDERQGKTAYAAMIESVDDSVGEVMAALKRSGQMDNTLVIFTSDNGGFAGATDNSPLRANKGSHYEGGIRVPLIIAGKGVTQQGFVDDTPVISADLYPTILAMTGIEPRLNQHVDGASLAPQLHGFGEMTRESEDVGIYWHYPHYNQHPQSAPVSIIRRGKWKLIEFLETGAVELYNLEEDIGETTNLAEQSHDVADELLAQLRAWKEDTGADPMLPNAEFRQD